MLISIRGDAAAAVLLVRPEDHANGPARAEVQLLPDPQRFPRHHASAAIIGRAGADIPRIEVAADDDHFVGPLAAADLADDVGRFGVGLEVSLHLQPHHHFVAAVGHPLQAVGVLGGDGGRGDLLHVARVLERAGVRRAKAGRSDRANQHRDRPVTRGARWPTRSESHGLAIVGKRHVEQHDFSPRRRPPGVEFIEALDDEHSA